MFGSTDFGSFDLSNVYPTDDLIASALANQRTNYSISDNQLPTSTLYFDNSNLSLKDQIALEIYEKNGPVRDELGTALSLTIIYAIILFSGVIGNICTCIVIVKNKYLHTSVNYYLFSLACSDLLLLILGLPQEMYMLWQRYPYIFGEKFCILRAFTSETSTNASILTITAFTIERYLAICHPLKAQTMSQLSRAIKAILIIWFIAAICSIPPAAQLGIIYQKLNSTGQILPQTAQCVIKNPLKNSFEISALCFFILPMAVISVLYILIGLALRRSSSISNTNSSASHHSPHHMCNQVKKANKKAKMANSVQRNNNSIVLDNNSSPTTTLIYNDSKSVTFCTNEKNRTNSTEQIDLKADLNRNDLKSDQTKLNNYLNTEQNRLIKDKDETKINSPSTKTTRTHNRPSIDEQELIEINNNHKSAPLFLNINNGTTLAAHRPSDLINSTTNINSTFNSSNTNNLNVLNPNHNSTVNTALTPTVTVSSGTTGNSIHHYRHNQAAASRRSVLKMLVAVVVSFFICWSFFHAQRIMASHIGHDSPEFLILIYRLLTYVSAITYYLTATINPILYQLMSLKFRLAFKETFGCWAPFLRPTTSCHHSSCTGPAGAGQTTTVIQAAIHNHNGPQNTNAITYDQSSSNQKLNQKIYSGQTSSVSFASQNNLNNGNAQQTNNGQNMKNGLQISSTQSNLQGNTLILNNLPSKMSTIGKSESNIAV